MKRTTFALALITLAGCAQSRGLAPAPGDGAPGDGAPDGGVSLADLDPSFYQDPSLVWAECPRREDIDGPFSMCPEGMVHQCAPKLLEIWPNGNGGFCVSAEGYDNLVPSCIALGHGFADGPGSVVCVPE